MKSPIQFSEKQLRDHFNKYDSLCAIACFVNERLDDYFANAVVMIGIRGLVVLIFGGG